MLAKENLNTKSVFPNGLKKVYPGELVTLCPSGLDAISYKYKKISVPDVDMTRIISRDH